MTILGEMRKFEIRDLIALSLKTGQTVYFRHVLKYFRMVPQNYRRSCCCSGMFIDRDLHSLAPSLAHNLLTCSLVGSVAYEYIFFIVYS